MSKHPFQKTLLGLIGLLFGVTSLLVVVPSNAATCENPSKNLGFIAKWRVLFPPAGENPGFGANQKSALNRIQGFAIHPKTGQIYVTDGQPKGQLYHLEESTGEITPIGNIGFDKVDHLAFHPDGYLSAWSKQGLLQIDLNTGAGTLIWPPSDTPQLFDPKKIILSHRTHLEPRRHPTLPHHRNATQIQHPLGLRWHPLDHHLRPAAGQNRWPRNRVRGNHSIRP